MKEMDGMDNVYNNDVNWPEWIEELHDNGEELVQIKDFSWEFLDDDSNSDTDDA